MNTKSISIRFSAEQYADLQAKAQKQYMPITQMIKQAIDLQCNFNWATDDNENLTLADVKERVRNLEVGRQFTLKSLYKLENWFQFSIASRKSIGKLFINELEKEQKMQEYVKFVSRGSSTIYERI